MTKTSLICDKSRTLRGEVIGITERISNEWEGNGGARALVSYLQRGSPLAQSELDEAKSIVRFLRQNGDGNRRLAQLAVAWALNPQPIGLEPHPFASATTSCGLSCRGSSGEHGRARTFDRRIKSHFKIVAQVQVETDDSKVVGHAQGPEQAPQGGNRWTCPPGLPSVALVLRQAPRPREMEAHLRGPRSRLTGASTSARTRDRAVSLGGPPSSQRRPILHQRGRARSRSSGHDRRQAIDPTRSTLPAASHSAAKAPALHPG
jgi:hypothetical protein